MFTPQSVSDMVASIAQELGSIVQTTGTQAGADPGLMNEIQEGIDGLRTAASALSQAEGSAAAQPILQRIAADANAVLGALAMLPLPPPASTVIRIVQVLVPTVIAAGNMIWPQTNTPAAQRFAQRLAEGGGGQSGGQQGGQPQGQQGQPQGQQGQPQGQQGQQGQQQQPQQQQGGQQPQPGSDPQHDEQVRAAEQAVRDRAQQPQQQPQGGAQAATGPSATPDRTDTPAVPGASPGQPGTGARGPVAGPGNQPQPGANNARRR